MLLLCYSQSIGVWLGIILLLTKSCGFGDGLGLGAFRRGGKCTL